MSDNQGIEKKRNERKPKRSFRGGYSVPEMTMVMESPRASELVIAPGRHFKVSGEILHGRVPDDAVLRVSLINSEGEEVRYAQTNKKGGDNVSIDWYQGPVCVFDEDTELSEIAYTAPELVVADVENPEASASDSTIKAVYTDNTFAALIACATDTEHGLAGSDCYSLTDSDGCPLSAFPEGNYTIKADLHDAAGNELSMVQKDIIIGWKNGVVVHSLTSEAIINEGGMLRLMMWAKENQFTVLNDLLPGMFGPCYQMSTMDMSYATEQIEYAGVPIHTLLYNIHEYSTSYCMELAGFLQREHIVENYEIAHYHAFSLGEPSLDGKYSTIRELDPRQKIHILRIDSVTPDAVEGQFLMTEEQVLGFDTNGEDGWMVKTGNNFAVMGAVIPYQLKDDEIIDDTYVYGYCEYLNDVAGMKYTIRDLDGSQIYKDFRQMGIKRGTSIQELEEREISVYEFYNVFSSKLIKEGHSYEISMEVYDRHREKIPGMEYTFTLKAY